MFSRRTLLAHAGAGALAAVLPTTGRGQDRYDQQYLLDFQSVGTATLIHLGDLFGQVHPHLMRPAEDKTALRSERHLPENQTGELLRIRFGVGGRQPMDYALTHAHFAEDAMVYGPMGGLAHIATVVEAIRAQRPGAALVAGQGAALLKPLQRAAPVHRAQVGDVPLAVIEVTDIDRLPDQLATARAQGAIVVCRSALGVAANRVLAAQGMGIDLMLCAGDAPAFPEAERIGDAFLVATGTQGRFVSRIDLDVQDGRLQGIAHRLIPVFADIIAPAPLPDMPGPDGTVLGTATKLLYRQGRLGSTWDDLICDALLRGLDADVALVLGAQHGVAVLPGAPITQAALESVLWGAPARTSPTDLTGSEVVAILEAAAEAVFHPDPLRRTATAMMRAGGIRFAVDPDAQTGARIGAVTHADGTPFDLQGSYKVAQWGVGATGAVGPAIADVMAGYFSQRAALTPD
ncbi:5'-nucleotidase C-terminal domain-containing protein [Sulfitobacter sp. JB4-11]|uniref:5'-nucleotidase C-terminal domain-containing protein n=1 Tax=Sulfitobacter rhodophyticola TaxID=3238304 RepID=UPI00351849A2